MPKTCEFCHEPILEADIECPCCGEATDLSGSTRHFFRQYYFRACPICEAKPILRTALVCPQCEAPLHQFTLEWGVHWPHAEEANRLARKLAKAEKPAGITWEHQERKARIRLSVDVGADRMMAFSFKTLCMYARSLDAKCRHSGRLCKPRLPENWITCFFGYREMGDDMPGPARVLAWEDYDWRGEYLKERP